MLILKKKNINRQQEKDLPLPAGVSDRSLIKSCPHCINHCDSFLLSGPALALLAGENSDLLSNLTFGRSDPSTPFCLGSSISIRGKKKQAM